nr:MFS transporter [uncultured Desulfuromonas sp.]
MKRLMQLTKRRFYAILAGEDALDRACDGIPDSGCHELPYNFSFNVVNGAATKLAEQVAGPNLILVWLLQLLGSPVWMFGFLVPIKQAGSLLPQLVASGQIRRLAVRKWVWVSAAVIQAVALLLMIPVSLTFSPLGAGLIILTLFTLFSVASGTASIAFQDVLAKTIIKGHRGRLLASRALIGGLLTMAAGAILPILKNESRSDLMTVFALIVVGAGLWLIGAACFAVIRERAGETQGGRNPIHEMAIGIDYFKRYAGFRRFLLARALLLSVELATPFYFLHASHSMDVNGGFIGQLVLAIGVAQVLSSPFWGKLADRTSKTVMTYSAVLSVAAALLILWVAGVCPASWQQSGFFISFVLVGLAESGVRLGRKTYLVDAITNDDRATCVAFTNSSVGILALLAGGAGIIAQWFGSEVLIAGLVAVGVLAIFSCRWMPEADQMMDDA